MQIFGYLKIKNVWQYVFGREIDIDHKELEIRGFTIVDCDVIYSASQWAVWRYNGDRWLELNIAGFLFRRAMLHTFICSFIPCYRHVMVLLNSDRKPLTTLNSNIVISFNILRVNIVMVEWKLSVRFKFQLSAIKSTGNLIENAVCLSSN